ncbi:hypothetical protein [Gordonia sp. VNK21]|uniref:hypothetical protein n=1 Tax=Gordonia sp. VNK21 TaxID=3382483 RepID=UPI0038D47284
MTVIVLLSAAVVLALAAAAIRRALVSDTRRTDRQVLTVDVAASLVLGALLAAAAVCAAVAPPPSDAVRITGQVLAVLVAATGGGYPVRIVLHAGGIPTRTDNFDDPPDAPALLRGGRVIGVLERTAVAICLILGWPAGLAVVLAVKSLARFPELREHPASEQFILGTFASVLWAAAAAGVGCLPA